MQRFLMSLYSVSDMRGVDRGGSSLEKARPPILTMRSAFTEGDVPLEVFVPMKERGAERDKSKGAEETKARRRLWWLGRCSWLRGVVHKRRHRAGPSGLSLASSIQAGRSDGLLW